MADSIQTVYPNLRAGSGVDWQHVDTGLLSKLNDAGGQLHQTITIFSGYRSPSYSASVGGYANDPHTRGVAVDASIGGTYIGNFPGAAAVLEGLGLEPGVTSDFYNGKPDPMHVQIKGSGINKSIHALATYAKGGVAAVAAAATPGGAPPTPAVLTTSTSGMGCLPTALAQLAILASLGLAFFELFH